MTAMTNDANPDRHDGEREDEHYDGGDDDDDGGYHNRGSGGGRGFEIHDDHICIAP